MVLGQARKINMDICPLFPLFCKGRKVRNLALFVDITYLHVGLVSKRTIVLES